jgi:glycosyltransferase involved in cell wall biosynthesis
VLLSRRLKEFDDHIYHSPNYFLPTFPGKSIATFHDMSIYRHPEYHQASQVALMEKEIPKSLEHADHIIAVSEFTKREIIDITGYPEDQITVIYNGVSRDFHPRPEEQLRNRLARYHLKPHRYFLSMATIEPRKNIDTILDAYQRLPESIRNGFPLVIGGAPGWKSQALHERIQQLASGGQVRYLGYVSEQELPILYAGATAKIFVPFYEGFGLPALEAMASGIPVIASNTSSLPEVVGEAGYCVSPMDVDAITTKMVEWAENSEDAGRRIRRGINIAKKLSWTQCVSDVVGVYQQVSST